MSLSGDQVHCFCVGIFHSSLQTRIPSSVSAVICVCVCLGRRSPSKCCMELARIHYLLVLVIRLSLALGCYMHCSSVLVSSVFVRPNSTISVVFMLLWKIQEHVFRVCRKSVIRCWFIMLFFIN